MHTKLFHITSLFIFPSLNVCSRPLFCVVILGSCSRVSLFCGKHFSVCLSLHFNIFSAIHDTDNHECDHYCSSTFFKQSSRLCCHRSKQVNYNFYWRTQFMSNFSIDSFDFVTFGRLLLRSTDHSDDEQRQETKKYSKLRCKLTRSSSSQESTDEVSSPVDKENKSDDLNNNISSDFNSDDESSIELEIKQEEVFD